ncbi:MAG: chitobiase/beta-hexosaminidase C-terminal domain-containing protein [Marinovum sp.]|nr:chitobiase/beta-hexosaminidase C-terminal domain-containing protein [Marinovum sp.]
MDAGAGGLKALKTEALKQGRWCLGEDGYIEKDPFPKEKTTIDVSLQGSTDTGETLLGLTPRNAGDSPVVHYSPKAEVTEADPRVDDLDNFSTSEGSLYFWVKSPTGKFESGPPVRWVAELKIRHQVDPAGDKRRVTLQSTPRAAITYSLDGSNPRDGIDYTEPFEIGPEALRLLVYASAGKANKTADFQIPASGDKRVQIDDTKPARLQGKRVSLDTTDRVYGVINEFKDNDNTLFRGVHIEIGEGEKP